MSPPASRPSGTRSSNEYETLISPGAVFAPGLSGERIMAQLWTALFTIVIGIFGAVLWFWGANWCLDRLLPVRGPDPARNSRNIHRASLVRPWLFLGPAVLALTLYLVYPVVASLWLSFHDKSGQEFVGGDNYAWLLSDPGFHEAIVNNFLWLLVVPAASTFLGLLAAALTDRIKWGNFAKSLIFMPMAISFVGAAVIWKFVYDYRAEGSDQIGILNAIVAWFGGDPQAWITIPFWNNFFLMVILVWIQTGFAMVILSAALRGIPEETIEAAVLDGASGIQIFFKIMVPQIWGTIAVAAFMLVYYMTAGVVANVALLANIIILLGVMCSVGTVLTLPGIAGIVLTIGMAVDANVLIYERIREESAKGKSLKGAISAGYDRAFSTIFDSNLTTLIASVLLIYLGSGPIKGFGVTLTIGICVSMFTALVVTRLIFDFLTAKNLIRSLPMLHLIRGSKIDFMRLAKVAFTISWAIILAGLIFGQKRMGIDFAGGDSVVLQFSKRVPQEEIQKVLESKGIKDPRAQYQGELGAKDTAATLRVTSPINTGETVTATLKASFPDAKFTQVATEQVGPTVGDEILKTGLLAVLASLFLILVYVAFRYEVSFAVAAVVAVIHDVLMTLGVYCLAGREFNATFIAAILTIIGFSINDTIVIFDRIREDLKLGARGSFVQLINQALNETLSRTIITSGTVFIATIVLYLFGGGAINDFAFTFLVGIITGTYSSIYIASAIVLWWHKGQRPPTTTVQVVPQGAEAAKA